MPLVKLEPRGYITDAPRYPDFPYLEWKRRIDRAQELMKENDVDLLLVFKRENVRYFFGFQTTHWDFPSIQPAVGLIPVEGEPGLVVSSLVLINAQAYCWTRNIWSQGESHDVVSQRALPAEIANDVKQLGYGRKNIALEMGYLGHIWIPRPLNDIESLKEALPGARYVDGDKVIWGCRMIKSPLEIDRIRKSIDAVAAVQAAIAEGYRPGMSEVDLMRVINRARAEQDGMGLGDDAVSLAHFTAPPRMGLQSLT